MSESKWEAVVTYGTLYEAEIAAGRLESSGIPFRLDKRGAVGMFGPGHEGKTVRGVALLVPVERLDDARLALDLNEVD
jgi:hypothetical protein